MAQPLQPNDQNFAELANILRGTLTPQVREAERRLQSLEPRPQYSLCLLQLLMTPAYAEVAHPAAIAFKNFILRNWVYDGTERQEQGLPDLIQASDRTAIKQHLITLMVGQSKLIQEQLSQSLAIISRCDFPDKWNTLLPELVKRFAIPGIAGQAPTETSPEELVGVLGVMHSIFFRYRSEMKSQKLWAEILYVLKEVAEPLTALYLRWCARITDPAYASNPAALPIIINILSLILDNFYSLNSQDIAAQFEDTEVLKTWLASGQHLLKYTSPHLEPKAGADQDEPTKLDTLKSTICDIANMYVYKYEDQFSTFVSGYVTAIWSLLTTLTEAKRYDHLVNSAIKFLTSVVKKEQFKSLFANETALKEICEKVIIPQLKLRESDLYTFEFDESEWIRIDIEGSDVDTRRRTVVDFIHSLTLSFEQQISQLLKSYVEYLLKQYESTKTQEKAFLLKDSAMYIILALSSKKATASKGVIEVNPFVDIGAFFQSQVFPELLTEPSQGAALIKANCLKYVAVFRQQLPVQAFQSLIPVLIKYLGSDNLVLHTYACYALERMLSVKDATTGVLKLDKELLRPHLQSLLTGLFSVLAQAESRENEYAMKGIMRVCSVGQDAMVSFAPLIIQHITQILMHVVQNPRNPKFSHSLFETIAALVKYLCKSNVQLVDSFEASLFPPFQQILSLETDFPPYVFQILAQLLEFRTDISPQYIAIFPALLTPALWLSNPAVVPPCTRLLQAYLHKKNVWAAVFQGNDRFDNGILGLIAQLLKLRSTEALGMNLATSTVVDIELQHANKLIMTFLSSILFPKLQPAAKPAATPRLLKATVVFFCAALAKHGLDTIIQMMNQIQQGIFSSLYGKLVLPNLQYLNTETERKLGAIVVTNLVTSPTFLNDAGLVATWAQSVAAIVKLCTPKESKDASNLAVFVANQVGGGDAADIDADDLLQQSDVGFTSNDAAAATRLVFATVPETDYLASVTLAPKDYFKQKIDAVFTQFPGKFGGLLASLSEEEKALVSNYFTTNQIAVR